MRWIKGLFTIVGGIVVIGFLITVLVNWYTREQVPDETVLFLDLEQPIVESVQDDLLSEIMGDERLVLRDLVDAIDRAAGDQRVKGLVARVGAGEHGFGMTQEIRQAILRFRESGKPAMAFAETMGELQPANQDYYLATAFDRIFLQESGAVGLVGLAAETPFARDTLEKLDIEPRLSARGDYKTVTNTLTERAFTDAHREVEQALVDDLFTVLVDAIGQARGIDAGELRSLIDGGPFIGEAALDAGLVDGFAYRDQVTDMMEGEVGGFESLPAEAYLRLAGRPHQNGTGVALIHGSGQVVRGNGNAASPMGDTRMGSDAMTRAFKGAIEDDDIQAIVFRIDSPGGSAVASDTIWRLTHMAREAGKPVVASMGNVAASGGYYAAMPADRVIAQPGTFTGSIGVAGGKLVTAPFWQENLGVRWDMVTTSENATMYSLLFDYTELGWQRHEQWLNATYAQFVGKAAADRGMPEEAMHQVARGRVWTGNQALGHGLVDELGGYHEAWMAVRELLDLEADAPLHIRPFPPPRGLLEILAEGDIPGAPGAMPIRQLESLQGVIEQLQRAGLLGHRHALESTPRDVR